MGKKRRDPEDEYDGPLKKLKRDDRSSPSRRKNRINIAEKSVKKNLKKSSHKHKSKHRKKRKRRDYNDSSTSDESSSSNSTSSSSSTSTDSDKKKKRRIKKEKKRQFKKLKCRKEKLKNRGEQSDSVTEPWIGPMPPGDLNKGARSMAPMTKEEWEKRQSVVKRVYDEETGRHRLIKGDGEILEELVSRDRHKEINRMATKGDGGFFENSIQKKLKSSNS